MQNVFNNLSDFNDLLQSKHHYPHETLVCLDHFHPTRIPTIPDSYNQGPSDPRPETAQGKVPVFVRVGSSNDSGLPMREAD